jgi:hypothetical protein
MRGYWPPMRAYIPQGGRCILLEFVQQAVAQIGIVSSLGLVFIKSYNTISISILPCKIRTISIAPVD